MIDIADFPALIQVILVDLVLAGDNAIVVALVVAGCAPEERPRMLILGIVAAACVRILFAFAATQIMKIVGLMLVGGLLLAWLCFKLWRELESGRRMREANSVIGAASVALLPAGTIKTKSVRRAVGQIVLADVSMSLDNVIAVAGIARDNVSVLAFGLIVSIASMMFAASFVVRLLNRHYWVAYLGVAIIVYVAGVLIWDGSVSVVEFLRSRAHPASG